MALLEPDFQIFLLQEGQAIWKLRISSANWPISKHKSTSSLHGIRGGGKQIEAGVYSVFAWKTEMLSEICILLLYPLGLLLSCFSCGLLSFKMSLKYFKSQIYLVFSARKCKKFVMFATRNKISQKVPIPWLNGWQGTVFCQKFESTLTLKYWNSGILVQIIHIPSHFLKYTVSNIRKISLFNQMSDLCWVFGLFKM